jgi:phosphatidylserine decarboxylase
VLNTIAREKEIFQTIDFPFSSGVAIVRVGQWVNKGDIFGMIRIGSQVDVMLPWKKAMTLHVKPGMKVRAGKSILIS